MTRTIVLRPEAVEDLRETRSWYESRKVGLGDEFLVCVGAAPRARGGAMGADFVIAVPPSEHAG